MIVLQSHFGANDEEVQLGRLLAWGSVSSSARSLGSFWDCLEVRLRVGVRGSSRCAFQKWAFALALRIFCPLSHLLNNGRH